MTNQSERNKDIVAQQELLPPTELGLHTPKTLHGNDVAEQSEPSQEASPKTLLDTEPNTIPLAQPLTSEFLVAQADAKPHSQTDESNDEEDELDEEEQTKPETSDEVIPDAAPVEASSDEGSLVSNALSDTGDESFSISTLGWTGIGLGLIGIAAASGGSTPPPDAPSIALDTDTGKAADDGITTVGTLSVTGLSVEAAATWEYSTDGGTNWVAGQGSAITLTDAGSFVVVVRQTVGDQVSESSASVAVTLDLSAATVDGLVSSSADQTIVLNYSEALDDTSSPDASAFTVRQGGVELAVDGVVVSGSTVTLSMTGLASGSLQVAYAVPTEGAGLQDLAGNSADGFSQIVVSDGYIRGAKVYLDANVDGVGDESELLEGVTSNSAGEILVEGDAAAGALIIVGGVNTDTGAVNTLTLSAPVGYSVVNPLSTLVAKVIKSADPDAVAPTVAEAEALVVTALGLTLADGESLSSYDPLSDTSEAVLANRIVTAQIATILVTAATASADAGAGEAAEAAALNNLATIISSATEDAPVTLDAATVASVLTDAEGTSLVSAEQLTAIQTSVETLETATSIEAVVIAQAEATDKVSAAAPSLALVPESDSGASASDGLTNVVTPSVQVSFDTTSLDGTAVIVGDRVEVLDATDGSVLATAIVTAADLASGAMTLTSLALNDGAVSLVARVTDIAGNLSANAAVSVDLVVDTIPAVITSASAAQVDENSAAPQVVYTAVATDAGGGITFSLAGGANDGLSIDAGTGAVSLATSPDFETLSSYSFTVVATDGAGNVSEQGVELSVTNLDDTAPAITSGATATSIAENSGAGQVIYTAVADDTADTSDGVTFSLSADSDDGLAIDEASGEVTLAADPNEETQASYSFTVTATDAAGNASDQAVALSITDLDDTTPTMTSAATGTVLDYESLLYTAVADDSADVSAGITYSLQADTGDASLLKIDGTTGAVSLASGVTSNGVKSSYGFTVLASDGVTPAATQAVTIAVTAPTVVSGPGMVTQGGLTPSLVANDDGTSTLSVALDSGQVANYPDGIENVDFTLTYNVSELGLITDDEINFPGGIASANTSTDGQVGVAVIWFPAEDADVASIIDITYTAPESVTTTSVSLSGIIVGNADLSDASYVFGEAVVVEGTAAEEVFHLSGGSASVAGGAGADTFVLTAATGKAMTLSDFVSGEDTLEISAVAKALGYTSAGGASAADKVITQVASVPDSIADLITGNDTSLDNAYGAYFDDDTDKLTIFVDSSTDAGTVAMVTYEITLGNSSNFVSDDIELTSAAFIA
jgi:hypothetical protein